MADTSIKNRKTFVAFSPSPGVYPFGGPNLRFTDLSIVPKPMIDKTKVQPIGNTFASGSQRGLEWSDHSLERANFGFASAPYLFEMLVGAGDKTTVSAGIFKRVYEPVAGFTPRDMALHYGDPNVQLEQYLYVFLTGLGLKADLKTIGWTGAGKGKEVTYGVTGAGSTIDIPLRQANPTRDGLFLSSSYGGLGTPGASTPAANDRFMAFDFACGALVDVIATKKPGVRSWRASLETDAATGDVKLTVGNNSNSWAYLSTIRNDENFFGRYEVKGRTLSAGTAEVQTFDLSGDDDPTGGTFPLTLLGVTLTDIPWNVSAAELQTAIRSLDAEGAVDVTVSKTGFVYTATFPAYLGNVAQMTSSAAGLTGGVGDTFAITHATTTPGVASVRELFALDFGATFAAHFSAGDVAPLSVQDFPLWLVENSDINGWRATIINDVDSLDLAA